MPVVLLVVYNELPCNAGDALLTVSEADLCVTQSGISIIF